MVNLRGQVVGINSAIASQSGYYQGYGFAFPSTWRTGSWRTWSSTDACAGPARRPDERDRRHLGRELRPPLGCGVELTLIIEGAPAEAQGLRVYDVIVELDGQPIARSGQLQQAIAMKRPG